MADPVTWIAAAAGVGAVGSLYGAQANASAARYNMLVNQQNAQIAKQGAALEEQRFRVQSRKAMGQMRANIGASGGTVDSYADVLADSATNAELDALLVRYSGEMQSRGYTNTANLDRMQASAARTAGYYGAAGSLLQGGVNYYMLKRTG